MKATTQPFYFRGKCLWYLLCGRLFGPLERSGCIGEEKHGRPCKESTHDSCHPTNKMHYLSKNTITSLLPRRVSSLLRHLQGVYWAVSPLTTRAVSVTCEPYCSLRACGVIHLVTCKGLGECKIWVPGMCAPLNKTPRIKPIKTVVFTENSYIFRIKPLAQALVDEVD